MKLFNRFINDDSGATLIEYALVVALIAIVAIAGLKIVGPAVSQQFSDIGGTVANP